MPLRTRRRSYISLPQFEDRCRRSSGALSSPYASSANGVDQDSTPKILLNFSRTCLLRDAFTYRIVLPNDRATAPRSRRSTPAQRQRVAKVLRNWHGIQRTRKSRRNRAASEHTTQRTGERAAGIRTGEAGRQRQTGGGVAAASTTLRQRQERHPDIAPLGISKQSARLAAGPRDQVRVALD